MLCQEITLGKLLLKQMAGNQDRLRPPMCCQVSMDLPVSVNWKSCSQDAVLFCRQPRTLAQRSKACVASTACGSHEGGE